MLFSSAESSPLVQRDSSVCVRTLILSSFSVPAATAAAMMAAAMHLFGGLHHHPSLVVAVTSVEEFSFTKLAVMGAGKGAGMPHGPGRAVALRRDGKGGKMI